MKRILAMLIVILMLGLTACGQAVTGGDTPQDTKQTGETPPDTQNAGIANPWREITEAEADEIYPRALLVPDGAQNAGWSVMDAAAAPSGTPGALLQLDFDLDGQRFTARAQRTGDPAADISGMFYDWTVQDGSTLRNSAGETRPCMTYRFLGEDETADLCAWYDEGSGMSFTLSVAAKDLDGFDIRAVADAMLPVTVPPVEEQRRVLEENRSLWAFDEGAYAPDWYYAFTDLDHNGLLELLSASTQGSGIFTYVRFYEVLPDGSGVRNLLPADGELEGPADWPEIVLDSLTCYYDRAENRYYYLCSNSVRDGAWHGMTQLAALSLKNGEATVEYLAAEEIQYTDEGEQRTYTDGAGEPITEEEYNSAAERRFAGMEESTLFLEWNAVTAQTITARQDGERFEGVIILEGMEETVQYEHIRNEVLGFEMDYDYESFVRRSEADRECFVSVWDDQNNPENYLEVTHRAEDAETVAAAVGAALSETYEISRDDEFMLERAGRCIHIDASADKGGQTMPDQLQAVYIIPADDGCFVATAHYAIEASEGFGRRFRYMMDTFSVLADRAE